MRVGTQDPDRGLALAEVFYSSVIISPTNIFLKDFNCLEHLWRHITDRTNLTQWGGNVSPTKWVPTTHSLRPFFASRARVFTGSVDRRPWTRRSRRREHGYLPGLTALQLQDRGLHVQLHSLFDYFFSHFFLQFGFTLLQSFVGFVRCRQASSPRYAEPKSHNL